MTRTRTVLWGVLLMAAAGTPVAAQELKPSVFGSVSAMNVHRTEDQNFGTNPNVGGGFGIEWKRLGVEAELQRTIGLTPRDVSCAVTVPCVGSAREGFLSASMLTGNVSYFFGGPRARPYVTGSVGVLWTDSVSSITIVRDEAATLSEFTESDTGLVLGAGFGVDVPLTDRLSLRPEVRTYSSVAMSRVNLGLLRGTIGVRYQFPF